MAGIEDGMGREKMLLNEGWKFLHGDFPGAKTEDYEDGEWYDIGLPHSFGIPYFMEHEFYVGYGCYRKKLHVKKDWAGKCLYLEFLGSFQETEVYLNGELAGTHRGGYTPFLIDITKLAHPGDNQLFVRVNNLWNPRIAPRAGEHVFNGGIYRDVSLIVEETIHVAWYGTCVTTPEVSEEQALVQIATELENRSGEEVQCRLESILVCGETEAARICTALTVPAGETVLAKQEEILQHPLLWHPDTPHMYTLVTRLYAGERLADCCETPFGIRWFSFTADRGFFLNGKHYKIHGANVHQDHAGWSDAVSHTGIRRDISMVKECGMNFIRGSHYPHHPYFAEECDRQGILFWSENCFWETGGPREEGYWTASAYPVKEEDEEEFEQSCMQTLAEMIRVNRNHPSIIVWSMCNEPFFSNIEVMEKAKALVKKLVELSHRLDPTRQAAVGGVQRGGFDALGDVAGYNGDGASIFHDPGFPNFVSEYGSSFSDRPGTFCHRYRDGVEKEYPWRSGKSLWCAFHHGSILWDMGHMGIIDYYRLPLDDWYWYRENLRGIPAPQKPAPGIPAHIRLTSDRLRMKCDGTEDAWIRAEVLDGEGRRISNTPDVTLEIVSGGGIFPTGKSFRLSAQAGNFIEGLGAIELHALYGGDTVIRAVSEGLTGDELCICVDGLPKPDGWEPNILQAPPCVSGAPERRRLFDIGINRPVFASSAVREHPSRNVTDGDNETFWLPEETDEERWVLVDLEGTKEIEEVTLVFSDVVINDIYEVALTDDRKNFYVIYTSNKGDANNCITLHVKGKKARYIRVRFPEKAAGVCKVEIMA